MVGKAVDSVLAQTYPDIEIVLVDDGSNDDFTLGILADIASSQPGKITLVSQENGGPGPAREAGRRVASGEFIQYLDSDDWILPHKFEVQVAALRKQPECDIAYGITRLVDREGNTLKERSKHTGEHHETLFPLLVYDRWWHTSTPLYRRSLSDRAGAWPSRRPEDWDLEARMGAHSPRLVFCNTVVSCHREHDQPGRVSKGDQLEYLVDEAWFLPRLFDCARKAGIDIGSDAMNHLAAWSFMRARYLGKHGKAEEAKRLMLLAKEAAGGQTMAMKGVLGLSRIIGWRATGRVCSWLDRLRA